MIDTGVNLRIRHYIDDIMRGFVNRDDNAYSKIFDVSLYSPIQGSYILNKYVCCITGFLIILDCGLKNDKVFIEGEVKKLEDWLAGYGLVKGKVEIGKARKVRDHYNIDIDIQYHFSDGLFDMFNVLSKMEYNI